MSKIFTYTRQGTTRTMFLDVAGRVTREVDGTPEWIPSSALLSPNACTEQPRVEALKQKTLGALTRMAGSPENLQKILRTADAYYAMLGSLVDDELVRLPADASGSMQRAEELRRRFLDPAVPCFFPSCEKLREELRSAIDANGSVCPDCTKNQLELQFAAKAVEAYLVETTEQ